MNRTKHLRLKSPLIVQFEITSTCDSNCGFCYNFWRNIPFKEINMEQEKVTKLFDILIENNVPAVCLTGGEPFLEERLVCHFLEETKRRGLYTSINTNGRKISAETAERLKGLGLKSILVSIHGSAARNHDALVGAHGAFTETLGGITHLVSRGISVTANYVVSKRNVGDIVKTAILLRERGVRSLTLTPLLPFRGVKDHLKWALEKKQFKQYFEALRAIRRQGLKVDSTLPIAPCILVDLFPHRFTDYLKVLSPRVCMAGTTFMVVSPEGENRACVQAPELSEYGDNILEDFKRAWERAHKWSDERLIPVECRDDCCALPICGGGCRTSSLAMNDSVCGPTMYMGKPMVEEDAAPFLKRTEVTEKGHYTSMQFKKRTPFFRKEDFGATLANTSNQSFVFLNRTGTEAYYELQDQFIYDWGNQHTDRFIRVLWAAGLVVPSEKEGKHSHLTHRLSDEGIVHISEMFPRLGKNLPRDRHVRCLRGDTGERVFF